MEAKFRSRLGPTTLTGCSLKSRFGPKCLGDEETDYDSFKSEVANHQGKVGAAYEHLLHDVWSVMYRLQKEIKGG